MANLLDTKGSREARKHLPSPTTTNDGPVAVITINGVPYRFHLMAVSGKNEWKRVNAFGKQRCARQTCSDTFQIDKEESFQGVNKLYCSNTCRGRASEARRLSVRTSAFNTVDHNTKAASGYVAKPAGRKTRPS
jgi:hypothetical protein